MKDISYNISSIIKSIIVDYLKFYIRHKNEYQYIRNIVNNYTGILNRSELYKLMSLSNYYKRTIDLINISDDLSIIKQNLNINGFIDDEEGEIEFDDEEMELYVIENEPNENDESDDEIDIVEDDELL